MIFATQAEFTDICMIFLLTAMVYFLVMYEKKNHLYWLLKSTYKGRKYVIRAKLLTAAGVTCFLVLLLYGANYLFSAYKCGFGNLERPIQSVTAMYESPCMLSVGEYLIFYLLLKMLVCYVIALVMIWLAQKMSSSAGAVLGIGFIGIAEYLLYLLLPSVSYMDVSEDVKSCRIYQGISVSIENITTSISCISGQCDADTFLLYLPVCLLLLLAVNVWKLCRCDKVKGRWQRKGARSKVFTVVTDRLCLHELFKSLLTNKTCGFRRCNVWSSFSWKRHDVL